jgi:hypothetical protein
MRRAVVALVVLLFASCAGAEVVPPATGPVVSPGSVPELLATPRVAAPDPGRPRYDRDEDR